MVKVKSFIEKFYVAFIGFLLYAPLLVLFVCSFNDSKARTIWGGFTLHWYTDLFQNEEVLSCCSFDCWCKDTKIFCIYQILACDKGRFSAKHLRFETSLKNGLYFLWGASLCFCGVENYVLRYKSAYYEVIPDCMETYSVFSIQFFSPLLPSSV